MTQPTGKQQLARIAPKKPAADTDERRSEPRLGVATPVIVKVAHVGEVVGGRSVNVSRSGIFIATPNGAPPPAVGTYLDLEIALPDRRLLLHAIGEVVRHGVANGVAGVGVLFREISYESQELIDELLARQKENEG